MRSLGMLALVAALGAAPARAQGTLGEAAERARGAWLAHDPQALVGQSSTLVLQVSGADPSSPVGQAQAAELLRQYWRSVEERGVDVTGVREIEPGRGFVELTRRYVVAGTAEVRRETLFLAFRLREGRWVLVELRSAP